MIKSTRDNAKATRRRSPQTGLLIGVRLQPHDLKAVDEWASKQDDKPSRPEAMRRLIGQALGGGKKKTR
jgi:hypothetical protein